MLTVRDPAVLPVGFDAPKYEILPLDGAAMKAFVARWRPGLSQAKIEALVARIDAHPDMAALTRIPLFLSLLLATWDGSSGLPSGRAELIEAYLNTLFRPGEHKDTVRAVDPGGLRAASEALSFHLLERGEIGAGERDVRKVMASYAGPKASADQLHDDALRAGLLRRQGGGRLAFPQGTAWPRPEHPIAIRSLGLTLIVAFSKRSAPELDFGAGRSGSGGVTLSG